MLLVPASDHYVRTSLYRRLTGKQPVKDEKVTLIVTRERQKPDELTEDGFYPIGLTGFISEVSSGGYIVIRTGYRVNIESIAITEDKKIDLIVSKRPDIDDLDADGEARRFDEVKKALRKASVNYQWDAAIRSYVEQLSTL